MVPKHKVSARVFGALATLAVRAPWWVVGVHATLAIASVIIAALKLEMKTDQNDLVAADLPYNRRYLQFLEDFGDLEFLYAVIEVDGKPAVAMQVADAIAAEVVKLEEHVEGVLHRIPPESFGDSILLLTPLEEVKGVAGALASQEGVLRRLSAASGLPSLLGAFSGALEAPAAAGSAREAGWGFRILDGALESVEIAARGGDPGPLEKRVEALSGGDGADPRRQGYLFSENGELAFVEIMPRKDFTTLELIREPLAQIRSALSRVRDRFPGVRLGLTGRPVLQADEMKTTNDDMTYSTLLAFVGVITLFVLFFKRLRRPILAGIVLLVSLAITFAAVTLTIGYLTLLSIVFAVMLVGLGVDFGVILVARYQEELLETDDIDRSIRTTLLSSGMGIWTGALTTGCAFYSSLFVDFQGLAELGYVAGTGLMICLACMLTLLPALIVITDRHIHRRRKLHPPHPVTIPILGHAARHPRVTLAIFSALTLAGFLSFQGVPYDANLLDLQAKGLESVDYELKIIEKSERSTWYAAFILESLEGVDRTLAALEAARADGAVGLVESIRDFVPADQAEKKAALEPARALVASLRFKVPAAGIAAPELEEALGTLLDRLDHLQSLASSRSGEQSREAVKAIDVLIRRVEAVEGLLEADAAAVTARLAAYQARLFGELEALRARLEGLLGAAPITPDSLHPEVRRRFVSRDGRKLLVYAYPRGDIWQESEMEAFISAARRVDPAVTGAPVQVYESARLMHEGFLRAALYSLLMVFGFLLVDFRSLKFACLTMVPVILGVLWALQVMPLVGLTFNLANFFSLPIMIGCGVDAGVHMVHRFRETGSTSDVGRTTGSAVTLANLSNMIGFASMGIARHRGVASLGLVTALGCLTVLVASVVVLPCLLEVLKRRLIDRPAPAEIASPEPSSCPR